MEKAFVSSSPLNAFLTTGRIDNKIKKETLTATVIVSKVIFDLSFILPIIRISLPGF